MNTSFRDAQLNIHFNSRGITEEQFRTFIGAQSHQGLTDEQYGCLYLLSNGDPARADTIEYRNPIELLTRFSTLVPVGTGRRPGLRAGLRAGMARPAAPDNHIVRNEDVQDDSAMIEKSEKFMEFLRERQERRARIPITVSAALLRSAKATAQQVDQFLDIVPNCYRYYYRGLMLQRRNEEEQQVEEPPEPLREVLSDRVDIGRDSLLAIIAEILGIDYDFRGEVHATQECVFSPSIRFPSIDSSTNSGCILDSVRCLLMCSVLIPQCGLSRYHRKNDRYVTEPKIKTQSAMLWRKENPEEDHYPEGIVDAYAAVMNCDPTTIESFKINPSIDLFQSTLEGLLDEVERDVDATIQRYYTVFGLDGSMDVDLDMGGGRAMLVDKQMQRIAAKEPLLCFPWQKDASFWLDQLYTPGSDPLIHPSFLARLSVLPTETIADFLRVSLRKSTDSLPQLPMHCYPPIAPASLFDSLSHAITSSEWALGYSLTKLDTPTMYTKRTQALYEKMHTGSPAQSNIFLGWAVFDMPLRIKAPTPELRKSAHNYVNHCFYSDFDIIFPSLSIFRVESIKLYLYSLISLLRLSSSSTNVQSVKDIDDILDKQLSEGEPHFLESYLTWPLLSAATSSRAEPLAIVQAWQNIRRQMRVLLEFKEMVSQPEFPHIDDVLPVLSVGPPIIMSQSANPRSYFTTTMPQELGDQIYTSTISFPVFGSHRSLSLTGAAHLKFLSPIPGVRNGDLPSLLNSMLPSMRDHTPQPFNCFTVSKQWSQPKYMSTIVMSYVLSDAEEYGNLPLKSASEEDDSPSPILSSTALSGETATRCVCSHMDNLSLFRHRSAGTKFPQEAADVRMVPSLDAAAFLAASILGADENTAGVIDTLIQSSGLTSQGLHDRDVLALGLAHDAELGRSENVSAPFSTPMKDITHGSMLISSMAYMATRNFNLQSKWNYGSISRPMDRFVTQIPDYAPGVFQNLAILNNVGYPFHRYGEPPHVFNSEYPVNSLYTSVQSSINGTHYNAQIQLMPHQCQSVARCLVRELAVAPVVDTACPTFFDETNVYRNLLTGNVAQPDVQYCFRANGRSGHRIMGTLVADEMGLGKTVTSLSVIALQDDYDVVSALTSAGLSRIQMGDWCGMVFRGNGELDSAGVPELCRCLCILQQCQIVTPFWILTVLLPTLLKFGFAAPCFTDWAMALSVFSGIPLPEVPPMFDIQKEDATAIPEGWGNSPCLTAKVSWAGVFPLFIGPPQEYKVYSQQTTKKTKNKASDRVQDATERLLKRAREVSPANAELFKRLQLAAPEHCAIVLSTSGYFHVHPKCQTPPFTTTMVDHTYQINFDLQLPLNYKQLYDIVASKAKGRSAKSAFEIPAEHIPTGLIDLALPSKTHTDLGTTELNEFLSGELEPEGPAGRTSLGPRPFMMARGTLIVSTASAIGQWQAEVKRFLPNFTYCEVGAAGFKQNTLEDYAEADIVFASHQNVRVPPLPFYYLMWERVIIDEYHIASLLKIPALHTIFLSGTPCVRATNDVCNFLCPDFLHDYNQPWQDDAFSISHKKAFVPVHLPDRAVNIVEVPLSSDQRLVHNFICQEFLNFMDNSAYGYSVRRMIAYPFLVCSAPALLSPEALIQVIELRDRGDAIELARRGQNEHVRIQDLALTPIGALIDQISSPANTVRNEYQHAVLASREKTEKLLITQLNGACPVCTNMFTDEAPVVMECGHVFCSHCAHDIIRGRMICSTCDHPIQEGRFWRLDPESYKRLLKNGNADDEEEIQQMQASLLASMPRGVSLEEGRRLIPNERIPDEVVTAYMRIRSENPRLPLVLKKIEEIIKTDQVVVVSRFPQFVSELHSACLAKFGPKKVACILGSTSRQSRVRTIQQFANHEEIRVFISSTSVISTSLNLVAANHLIVCEPAPDSSSERQVVDRVHRIGQDSNVMIHRIVAPNSVESRLVALRQDRNENLSSYGPSSSKIPGIETILNILRQYDMPIEGENQIVMPVDMKQFDHNIQKALVKYIQKIERQASNEAAEDDDSSSDDDDDPDFFFRRRIWGNFRNYNDELSNSNLRRILSIPPK